MSDYIKEIMHGVAEFFTLLAFIGFSCVWLFLLTILIGA